MSVDTSGNASHDDDSFGPGTGSGGVRRSSSVDSASATTDSAVPHSLRFTALNQSSATVRTDSIGTECNTSTQGIETSSNVNASDSDTSSVFSSEHRVWPFDPETSTIDLRYLRSTDLPFNSFVHMPPPLREEEEMKFQNLKH